jgi:hypothetical protein
MASIYHITHIDNLSGIVTSGGLLATNFLHSSVVSVAYNHIQRRRSQKAVPSGGNLHDHVPFYFCPRSPMLYVIHTKPDQMQYKDGQVPMLHLVSDTAAVLDRHLRFTFTDRHAVLDYAEFFEDLNLLPTKLDWSAIGARSWANTQDAPVRKERKQAEFLVHRFMPFDLIQSIGVHDLSIKQQVQQIFMRVGKTPPPIEVQRGWYY